MTQSMKILITGGNGMVARAAKRIFESLGDEVVSVTKEELDISNRSDVCNLLASVRPDAVVNCAAYTNVDGCESNEEICFAVNSIGVENLAIESRSIGAKFVTISTDYVFDGTSNGFYIEEDVPNPIGVYGKSKLDGESRAIAANEKSIIVRSGWIYGSGGTNFLSIVPERLLRGEPVTAISDSYGTPTFADDLCRSIRTLIAVDASGVFHVSNSGEGTSYHGFAQEVAHNLGIPSDLVTAISEKQVSRPAQRPMSSKLASVRLKDVGLDAPRDWRIALRECLSVK
jgi:dTDP-4-dehydrorhamnose reductase